VSDDAVGGQADVRSLPAGLPLSASAEPTFRESYDLWSYTHLGEGHNAWVGTIRSLDMDRVVAVKIFKQAVPLERKDRVRAEWGNAEKVARTCPYIATIRRPFFRPTLTWLEMDYVPGATLRQLLDETPLLPFARARQLTLALFEGLDAAHRVGVVHRDIKPENLLIPASGSPPLLMLDFGISRSGDSLNITTTSLGTPRYAPPEVWRGEKHKIGPATDVYSAAIVAYELLAGAWPWHLSSPDPDPEQCFRIHTGGAGAPTDPSYLRWCATKERETLPVELRDLLYAGIDQDADRRPRTSQWIEVLRRTSDDPSSWRTHEPPRPYLPSPPPRRLSRRQALAAVVAGALALAVGAFLLRPRAPAAAPPGQQPAAPVATTTPAGPPPALRLALLDGAIAVTNRGDQPIADVQLTVPGEPHVATVAQLAPSRTTLLWASHWTPPLPERLSVTQLQARWRAGDTWRTALIDVER
jgi:hypothetical protein